MLLDVGICLSGARGDFYIKILNFAKEGAPVNAQFSCRFESVPVIAAQGVGDEDPLHLLEGGNGPFCVGS